MNSDSNILRHISENEHRHFIVLEENTEDAYMDSLVKPRKRRLDHLTWEEKIQRKKLKNRVAAQTSRDRKKAKMDLLEESFDKLMAQNKRVLAECENLKKLNETLRNENMELRQSLRQSTCPNCDSCSHHHQNRRVECDGHLSGSAARSGPSLGGGFDELEQQQPHSIEDTSGMPSLQDLLDELNKDVDIGSLDELTASLLADITNNFDAVGEDVKSQDTTRESGDPGQVVGPPSEQLEPPGNGKSVSAIASPFPLLHHDYSCKPAVRGCTKKVKTIKPKRRIAPSPQPAASLCGFYDEAENCITIIVDGEQDLSQSVAQLQEQLLPDSTTVVDTTLLSAPDISSSASDGGYESLGSPSSFHDDFFDSTVSALFPQLI